MMQHELQEALHGVLEQGENLLSLLTTEHYNQPVPQAFGATIGAHYRHSIEHIQAVLNPSPDGVIDYDARARDYGLETDIQTALSTTRSLRATCTKGAGTANQPVGVRCAVYADAGASPLVASSHDREYMYAIVHAIHHYALIACMCRLLGIETPAGFGMAPSTIQYQRSEADALSCAD